MSMPKLFTNDTIIVDEKVAFIKFENQYQLYDKNGSEIGFVQENIPTWSKIARFLINKSMLPFELDIQDQNGNVLAKIKRGFTLWLSTVEILDTDNRLLGTFKGKFKLMGSKFIIKDASEAEVGKIEGDWKGWNFVISDEHGEKIGSVNKKWHGAIKEIFTTADKYKVEIEPQVKEDKEKILILSVAIAIDMILKESK